MVPKGIVGPEADQGPDEGLGRELVAGADRGYQGGGDARAERAGRDGGTGGDIYKVMGFQALLAQGEK